MAWLTQTQLKKSRSDALEWRVFKAAGQGGKGIAAVEWLVDTIACEGYDTAVEMIEEKFDVQTSSSALSACWERLAGPMQAERARVHREMDEEFLADIDRDQLTDDAAKRLALLLRKMASQPKVDLKAVLPVIRELKDFQKIAFDKDKFRHAIKTDIERGLDALFEEIEGNPQAEELFAKFREVVTKA